MLRVGILGTGFGASHAKIYQQLPDVEIAGIFGRTPEKLQKLHDELGVFVTTKSDELITDPTIDIIDVCLPTVLHKEYVIKSLQQQKDVFCETPVSYTMKDAEAIKTAAERFKKRVFVDLFFKFSDPHKYAIETIHSGVLGKPLTIWASQKTPPHWGQMGIKQVVQDFMLHNFDFVTEIVGLPHTVTAHGVATENAYVVSTLRYSDCLAVVESTTLLPWTFPFCLEFTIICEKGTIVYEGRFGEQSVQHFVQYTGDTREDIPLPGDDEYMEAIKHVLACVATNAPQSVLSIDAAMQSLQVVIATQESVQQGCSVSIEG
ncbi:MAG: Gfo/Idh/MocA family oxidoreductase [Chloroflexi bacterium]|nr:Gfo/Idh/MocA family oxidoreductase [Chloroflexota bacterium]